MSVNLYIWVYVLHKVNTKVAIWPVLHGCPDKRFPKTNALMFTGLHYSVILFTDTGKFYGFEIFNPIRDEFSVKINL